MKRSNDKTTSLVGFLAKDVAVYGLANAFSKLFAIILVPIMTRLLTKEQYGMVDGINVLITLFLPIIIFGQDSAIARYYFDIEDDTAKNQMISQSLTIQLALAVLMVLVIEFFAHLFADYYFNNQDTILLIRLSGISLLLIFITQFSANILKWTFKRHQFLIITVGNPIIMMCSTIFFLKFYKASPESVFYGQIASGIIFSLLALFFIRKHLIIPKDFSWLKKLLNFGWPYFVVMFLPGILPSLDRYLIMKHIDINSLGLYALAFRIASLIQLPIFGFQTAWGPFAYSIYQRETADKTFSLILKLYVLVLLLFSLILNIFIEPVLFFFGQLEYIEAQFLIIPILFSILIESISSITGIGIDLTKKSYLSAVSYVISIILGAGISWICITKFGLVGLVLAGLFSKSIFTIVKTILSHIVYPISFDYKGITILVCTGIVLNLLLTYFFSDNYLLSKIGIGVIMLILLLSVFWFFVFGYDEKFSSVKKIRRYLYRCVE